MSENLTISALVGAHVERCKRWHGSDGLTAWTPERWLLAAAGELGEAANALKKLWRIEEGIANKSDDPARQLSTRKEAVAVIGKEIADTIHYLCLAAARLDRDLSTDLIETFNKTSEKYGFPERLA
jgi:NTP pyrophosphatase (non-canonical NTP hydrolase)